MFQENEVVFSINGNKSSAFDMSSLPSDAMALLAMMQNATAPKPPETKINVSETSRDLSSVVSDALKQVQNSENGLVRSQPQAIKTLNDKMMALELLKVEFDPMKKLTIYESGVALGISTGQTSKKEVMEIMKNYSKFSFSENDMIHEYSDIAVNVYFSDEDIVSEIKFLERYKGKTSKGLSINDTVERAIEIYGQPKMKSPKGAIWDKFAVFCDRNIITSIRVQK